MLSNMACSLIEHKRITTTLAKAKELRKFVEPLITKSKTDSTHSRRVVFSNLKSKTATSELFREVAPKVNARQGGYTRIIKLGTRLGDAAEMCMIELVDFNELMLQDEKSSKSKRRRRGGKKKSTEATAAPVETAEVVEEVKAETAEPEAPAAEAATEEAPVAEETKAEAPAEEVVEEAPAAEEAKEEAQPEAKAKESNEEEAKKEDSEGEDSEEKKS